MRSDLGGSPPEKVISLNFSFSSPEGATLSLTGPEVSPASGDASGPVPGLERALDLNRRGALTLVAHYQTPASIRRMGRKRLTSFLKNRGVKGAHALAEKALVRPRLKAPLCPQRTLPPVSSSNSPVRHSMLRRESKLSTGKSGSVSSLARRRRSSLAYRGWVRSSAPSFWWRRGISSAFESSDKLAAYAGLVPAAHDSGKRIGNDRRMRGGNKVLKRVFYQSAFASLRSVP